MFRLSLNQNLLSTIIRRFRWDNNFDLTLQWSKIIIAKSSRWRRDSMVHWLWYRLLTRLRVVRTSCQAYAFFFFFFRIFYFISFIYILISFSWSLPKCLLATRSVNHGLFGVGKQPKERDLIIMFIDFLKHGWQVWPQSQSNA